ncbi:class I SAM-dependent methyltransferase [Haladaptatus sp. CMSO5]|uniref:class I SAM-dependent methyltransferase n=1 Tax=Haladaptatus sp. CMSO5 TaxID=3120514 RepID=UPI002FCE1CBE
MGFHTFNKDHADFLDDPIRYRFLSVDELLAHLALEREMTVVDLGSGTGFYTDHVAPYVSKVHAVDVQEAMHDLYREKGVPENVSLTTAEIGDLPFADESLDAALSTMTYHEFADEAALAEVRRVLKPGGKLVVADWSANGEHVEGPPLTERFSLAEAKTQLEVAGFTIDYASERVETFLIAATKN